MINNNKLGMNLATWVTVHLLFSLSDSRIFQSTFQFSLIGRNNGWMYLDKMTFAPGQAEIIFDTYTKGTPLGRPSEMFLVAVPEDRWELEQEEKCKAPVRMPLSVHSVELSVQTTTSQFIFGVQDYTTYYFLLKDCQKRYMVDYNNSNLDLHVKLHLKNNDRQMGEEEDHWYIVPFIVGAGAWMVYYYFNAYAQMRDIDWAKILLFAGVCTQVSSLVWRSIGFTIYHFTGWDHYFFHVIYLLLHSSSESAVIALFTLVAFGWTLTFEWDDTFKLFLPAVGCMAFANVFVTLVTKIGNSHDRYHIFDSIGGHVLLTFRVVILLVFIFGAVKTYSQVRHSLKRFMVKHLIWGILYIGGTPIIVLTANYLIPARNRHEFVFIAIEMVKFVTNALAMYGASKKESEYNRVNYSNRSFIPEEDPRFK